MSFMGIGGKLETTESELSNILPKKNGEKQQTIYGLKRGDNVIYVGRTINYEKRMAVHAKTPGKTDLKPIILKDNANSSNAPYYEQFYIDYYKTLNSGLIGCNKRNEIGKNGYRRDIYNKYYISREIDPSTLDTLTYVGN